MKRFSAITASAVLATLALLVGCGGERLLPVSGTATRGGDPVGGLYVQFEPSGGEGSAGWGITGPDGRFTLSGPGGAMGVRAGTYKAWVDYRPADPDSDAPQGTSLELPAGIEQIESQYGRSSSPLSFELTGRTDNLELKLD